MMRTFTSLYLLSLPLGAAGACFTSISSAPSAALRGKSHVKPPSASTARRFCRVLLLSALALLPFVAQAQTTWTGATSTDWNTASNWSAGVPTTTQHAIIPDVTNDPVIGASTIAVAQSVHVQDSASLTIQATASLTINGFFDYGGGNTAGLRNEGAVANSGQLTLGSTASVGAYGLWNEATFQNNSGGTIAIDRASFSGLLNEFGTFTNAAQIVIGAVASVGFYGLYNLATFQNNSGGAIAIDRASTVGLYNFSGTFTNAAQIVIGAVASVGFNGLWNEATFENNSGGAIAIDRASFVGLYNFSGTFTNAAQIVIGAVASVGFYGLWNEATFENNSGGAIAIDRASFSGLLNEFGTFTNAAQIVIGAVASVGAYGLWNEATFQNNSGGAIAIDRASFSGLLNEFGTFTNAAQIVIGAVASVGFYGLYNLATFQNNSGGAIAIDRASFSGLFNSFGTFTNAAQIVIGAVASVGNYGLWNLATFENNSGGAIAIDRASTVGLFNNAGTFTNAAQIVIGAVASVGFYGLGNEATFENNSGGAIAIDRASFVGLYNFSGTFINAAQIVIGAVASVGFYGLGNEAIFENNSGGAIAIDRASYIGLYNDAGTFTNAAQIVIGAVASVGEYGLGNEAIFENNSGGAIAIDRAFVVGLLNEAGTFTNAAQIVIGAVASVGAFGLWNFATFENNSGGAIAIDRASYIGLRNEFGTFTNAAQIVIGAVASVGDYGIENHTSFQNNACAEIEQYAPLFNNNTFTSSGLMLVSTTGAHSNTALTNHGIIVYPQGNPIPNVTNNEIIVAATTANDCQSVSPAFGLGSPVDFAILGVFTDTGATTSAGTYAVATNTFTPTAPLSHGTSYNYFVKIQDGTGGCTRIVPWEVTVQDNTPPTFTCPANQNVNLNATCQLVVPNLIGTLTGMDNCGTVSFTQSPAAGTAVASSHNGTVSVTITASDGNGNTSTCSVTLTGKDVTPPTFTCPANQNVNLNATCQLVVPNLIGTLMGTDNCGTVSFTQSPAAGTAVASSHNGTVSVTITASDGNGNTSTCSVTLTGKDVTPPTFTCPANQNVNLNATCQLVVPNLIGTLTGMDNCGTVSFTQSPAVGTAVASSHNGTVSVTITASDGNGNTSTCSVTLTGKDVTPPTFTCPANQNVNLNATCQLVVPNLIGTLTGTDNCGTVSFTQSLAAGTAVASSHNGTVSVTITASDGNGNTSTCSVTLTGKDVTPPTFTCPANQNVNLNATCQLVVPNFIGTLTGTDNCGTVSFTQSPAVGTAVASSHNGTVSVTITASDGNGNTSTCSVTLTGKDVTPPTFTCPANQNVNLNATCQLVVPNLIGTLTGMDNCGTVSFTQSPAVGTAVASSHNGTVSVTITASDGNGNTSTCSVTLTGKDVTPPTFTCPANQNVNLNATCQLVVPNLIGTLTGTDNCGTVSFTQSLAAGTAVASSHNGTVSVTITASDGNGNTSTCSVTLTGKDVTPPTFTCPANQNVNLNATCQLVVPNLIGTLTGTDNCGTVSFTQSPAVGTAVASSHNGTVSVTITASDGNGNTSTCSVTLTGKDVTPPTVTCQNTSIAFNGELSIALSAASLVTVSDNCGVASVSLSPSVILCSQIGQTVPVTVTVTDAGGNVSTCTANVTVGGLPCGWSHTSGAVGCPSTASFQPGTGVWTQSATNCFYGPPYGADALSLVQRTLCGDGSITARVTGISPLGGGWAGIVMRESNALGARKVQLMTNLSNFHRREVRTMVNGAATMQQLPANGHPWLRIVRTGNQFAAYTSPNGVAWFFAMAVSIPMPECMVMGLVTTNLTAVGTTIATFDNVSATGNSAPLMAPAWAAPAMHPQAAALPDFSLYPNPSDGQLNLELSKYQGRAVRVEVYRVEGRLVYWRELEEVQGGVEGLDLSGYGAGVYVVKVKSEGLPDRAVRAIVR